MSKTIKDAATTTPNARSKLDDGVHWRGVSAEVHLGYRKKGKAGRWLVRWRLPDGRYKQTDIGAANDGRLEADGIETFDFEQAKSKAAVHVGAERQAARQVGLTPIPTIREVVAAYGDSRRLRAEAIDGGRPSDAPGRLAKHVLTAPIAELRLDDVGDDDLAEWRATLPDNLATSSVRRIVNDFRAALNGVSIKIAKRLPPAYFNTVKLGLRGDEAEPAAARDGAALPDADVRRVLEAARRVDDGAGWDGDLLRMVVVLAATGARFSQVQRLRVGDVQPEALRLMVPVSRKGRGTKRITHVAVRVGADVIDALRPAFANRRSSEPLLERWRHRQERGENGKPSSWVRDERGPWKSPAELTRPWAAIMKSAGLPADTVPYALRHSSIVRNLRARLPVRLVAQIHDTSDRVIERHYASVIVDIMDDLSAAAVVPLVEQDRGKVTALKAGA